MDLELNNSYGVNEEFNEDYNMTEIDFYSRFRFSDKFQMELAAQIGQSYDGFDFYGGIENDDIYFGNRGVKYTENNLSLNYNFDSYRSLSLIFRQFWSIIIQKQFFFGK